MRPGVFPGSFSAGLLVAAGLASGPALAQELFEETKEQCAACHGVEGEAAPEVPVLGGIDPYYALLQLVAFREGQRDNEIMQAMVADMSDDDLRAASEWVGSLPRPAPPEEAPDEARMEEGARLSEANRCGTCHGPEYLGGRQMPPLRNQHEAYLLKSLQDYKAERRVGARAAMVEIAQPLSDGDMETLAYYLSHLQ